MRKIFFSLLLLLVPYLLCAQFNKKHGSLLKKKNKNRKEYIIGIGGANFLGDLGGANQIGTHFIKDFEFSATRPSFALGIRYKYTPRLALKGGFYYQMVSGNDNLTTEPFRNNRNLHFRSPVYELSIQGEFIFTRDRIGHKYNIKNVKGMKAMDLQAYLFAGIGGFYFNPQAKYNDKWVNLQPLGTEGQGLPGGRAPYSRISMCIPYGVGIRYALNNDWAIGAELGIRKTFTDYLDDVSTEYYDNKALFAAHGKMGAYLADPSLQSYPEIHGGNASGAKQTAAGEQRGDSKSKDAYMFTNITISYKVPYRRRTRSKF